jgi:hypothetical protein
MNQAGRRPDSSNQMPDCESFYLGCYAPGSDLTQNSQLRFFVRG